MKLIFGFDIGTTSVGSAVIRYDSQQETGQILHLGTRIFPEARDSDGTPLNQQRRLARTMRRQVRRRRDRRKLLNETLAEAGLLPRFNSPDWSRIMSLDPYTLRKEGLERALTPQELGRALYHLSKRRHFRGRDLEESETETATESAEEKEAKSGREKTIQALKKSGLTLGAYLATTPHGERKRGIHANRDHVMDEFNRLVTAQSKHHPILTQAGLRDKLTDAIFAQKPVFWRKNTLGECRLLPGAQLASKASWPSIQKRMLEKLNNLAISGGNGRPLEAEERQAILDQLQTQGSMSWAGIKRVLEPIFKVRGESAKSIRFNLEEGGDKGLIGNPLEMKLSGIFGNDWKDHPHKQAIREAADTRLRASDYGDVGQRVVILREAERKKRRQAAARSFATDFRANAAQVAELEKLSFPSGWDAYSYDALAIILPELEEGHRFGTLLTSPDRQWHDWRNRHFPNRHQATGEILDRLPSPKDKDEAQRIRNIRNPTVIRVQHELRKVVNNLISVYGKPDLIRIEMTRDIGLSKAERDEKSKAMRNQEKLRKAASDGLKANGIAEPKRSDIEKWLLWKETGERDPYSGDHIGFAALFAHGEYEVEHIWPRSVSLDDSFANKTLCRKDMNLQKGNRLPFDAFSHDPDLWAVMKDRVSSMLATKTGTGMSRGKIRRFLAHSMPEEFTSRQLNDTGYAARQAIAFLKRLWPDVGPEGKVNVQPVNGKVTAHLRRLWGLNNILSDDGEKTRADHRHHAVDALVVACTDPGVSQRLSRYWQLEDMQATGAQKPKLDPPWSTIRQEADRATKAIIVSHRVRKKVSGPLHKGTIYGDTGLDEQKGKTAYRMFTVRKNLAVLSKSELSDIRDEAVKRIVNEWVAGRGGDPKKAFPPFPRVSPDGPEIKKARIWIKQQLGLMAPATTGYADLGNNHHITIYQKPDGKAEFEVVSLFEASRRLKAKAPVVRREREGAKFVMSLAAGEVIQTNYENKISRWIVKGIWAGGQIVLENEHDANGSSTTRPTPNSLLKMSAQKISVDPIGRIRPAHD